MEINKKNDSKDIDFKDILSFLSKKKLFLFSISITAALLSLALSFSIEEQYQSKALAMVIDEEMSSSQNPLSQYANIASVAGFDLAGSKNNRSSMVQATIKSRGFLSQLLKFPDVKDKLLLASREENSSFLEIYEIYLDTIKIYEDKVTGYLDIEVTHSSPQFAQDLIYLVVQEINLILREQDKHLSSKALDYLKEQIILTPQAEIKKSIAYLIEAELSKKMFADIREAYALSFIDEPFLPEKESFPNKILLVLVGFVSALILAVIFLIVREYINNGNFKD